MKKLFTLCAILSLFAKPTFAQINENFDNGIAPLAAECWQFSDMMYATNPSSLVINGTGSLYSEPPVSADSVRIMLTPFLVVESTIDVSFLYRLSNNLNGMATRFIKIDLIDPSGSVVQTLDSFQVANSATSSATYNQSFAVNVPGVYRLSITMGGKTGAGNVRLSLDNLYVSSAVVGCDASKVLPVHLVSFHGNMNKNNKVTLNWTIADNETVHSFEIERSGNGRDFTTVGVVFASQKFGNESYMFHETANTEKVMYRLRMIDKAHDIDYSRILIFQINSLTTTAVKVIGNPVNDKLTFSYSSKATQVVDIRVYDITGKILMSHKVNSAEGTNMLSLPFNQTFKSGMYIVEVSDGSDRQVAKFLKQ